MIAAGRPWTELPFIWKLWWQVYKWGEPVDEVLKLFNALKRTHNKIQDSLGLEFLSEIIAHFMRLIWYDKISKISDSSSGYSGSES